MMDLKIGRGAVPAAQMQRVLPFVAAVALLLAAWFAWSAWQHHRDQSRIAAVQQARDRAVAAVAAALGAEHKRLAFQLADPALRAAVARGDLSTATARLNDGWAGAEGRVLAPDLDAAYAALPGAGYGALATMEAALVADTSVARVIGGTTRQLALAAPIRDGERIAAVALVRLPVEPLEAAITNSAPGEHSYLALRQGGSSVFEQGSAELGHGAEPLAAKVPGSDLRVAAAAPDAIASPYGLSARGNLILAGAFILLAALTLFGWHSARRAPASGVDGDEAEASPTLSETIDDAPVKAVPPPVAPVRSDAPPATGVAIDRGIFRAYDIRGVVGESLDASVADLIGQSIGSLMHEQGLTDIVVGRDGRLSGPSLVEGLIAGLRRAGRNVTDIGLAPTPLVYFGAYHLRAGSCVSVTGSHNPPDYNGFKIVIGGETLSGDAITDLYARMGDNRMHTSAEQGTLQSRDINEDYVQRVSGDVQIDRPLKVVVDAGNGVAGELGPRVLAAVGAEVIPLYCEIDGTFPNHHPDPSEPHNLVDLIEMVERLDADLGVAFDGDGDRLGVVTREGRNIFPDRLLMLFAADVLERNPGAMIIYDVKCTGRLPGHILRHGGSPLMWKTGHSLIKAKMRETDAELAGEMSGHFFFKERWYGFDDGIYAAARLLEILAASAQSVGEQLDALPDGIVTPEIKVDAPEGNPHAFVERFVAAAQFEGARLSTIDGLRVDWPDGWGLVRASNTTPVLVMRFDADSREALARIQSDFREQLLALMPELKLPF
ncbi:MAG: phosphomannomutase/phosphoglucomutase [Pseudomonadota bacterium]|nr:phosphomannomutase/phosphoglucomutase [Pseudomonadota bacterium]